MEIPFVGPSYQLLTRPSGVQRTINLVPVAQEPGNERVAWVFKDAPGLEAWSLDPGLEPDPFFEDVILLIQNGEIIDRSPYAHSLTNSGTTSATAGVASVFPGGFAVNMACSPLATGGLVIGTGPEFTMGADSWCMEAFVSPAAGANGLQDSTQTLFTASDDRSRMAWFLLFNTGRMFIRLNGFDIPAPVTVPLVARGQHWFVAIQFYAGSVAPWMWVGEVGDPTATGDVCLTNTPRPTLGPLTGPYLGYQPTDAFVTANYKFAMRITNAERYAPAATIPIPTALWPVF